MFLLRPYLSRWIVFYALLSYFPTGFHIKLFHQPTPPLHPIIKHNACAFRLPAAAGTNINRHFFTILYVIIIHGNIALRAYTLHHDCKITGSYFRTLPYTIPHCCPPQKFRPYLSSDVADQSPNSATDRSLGEPLPHQQAIKLLHLII